ncbi:MAG: hypothetical protein ABSG53_13875, partial [Thermoguttaceae bacterium]
MNKSSTTSTIPGLELGLLSSEYVEQVYSIYQEDPAKVSPEWQQLFRGLQTKPSVVQPAQVTTRRPLRSGVSTVAQATAPSPSTSLVPATVSKSNGETAAAPAAPAGNGAAAVWSQAGKSDAPAAPASPAGNGETAGPLTVNGNRAGESQTQGR